MKYGNRNFWSHEALSTCSTFFKRLSKTADLLKPYLWINYLNPSVTFVLHHPWMFEIPIAYKPVYLNMDINFEVSQISNFLDNATWNIYALNMFFWNQLGLSYDQSWEDYSRGI